MLIIDRNDDKANQEMNRHLRDLDSQIGDVELQLNRMAFSSSIDINKVSNIILLWEWMWCHCINYNR